MILDTNAYDKCNWFISWCEALETLKQGVYGKEQVSVINNSPNVSHNLKLIENFKYIRSKIYI